MREALQQRQKGYDKSLIPTNKAWNVVIERGEKVTATTEEKCTYYEKSVKKVSSLRKIVPNRTLIQSENLIDEKFVFFVKKIAGCDHTFSY